MCKIVKRRLQSKKEYSSNPLLVAKEFENNGATHLHVVDLEGAKSNNYKQEYSTRYMF